MAKKTSGDWRDADQVTRWVRDIVGQLGMPQARLSTGQPSLARPKTDYRRS